MAIDYSETEYPARKIIVGDDEFELVAGGNLKIETSPGGEEILDETVPVGKTWAVRVFVHIVETNA